MAVTNGTLFEIVCECIFDWIGRMIATVYSFAMSCLDVWIGSSADITLKRCNLGDNFADKFSTLESLDTVLHCF